MRFTLSERDRTALEDIQRHINLATSFVENVSREEFVLDTRTLLAVTRCLEIISEASRRLSSDIAARPPEIPWRAIASSGNIYRLEQDNVEPGQLWQTVARWLPPLLEIVVRELATSRGGHAKS